MREMYKNEADSSPTSPESESSVGVDPFHDRFPWFRLIGRAFVYLSNLLYSLSLIQKVAVVNEHGDVVGYLRIAIQAVTENESEPSETDKSFGCRQSVRISFNDDDIKLQQIRESWSNRTSMYPFYINDLTQINRRNDENSLTCIDQVNNNYDSEESDFTLKIGEEVTFRVIILQVIGIAKEYRDVFCQFNFLHLFDEAFSTEPIKNTGTGPPPGFFRMQNITVTVTTAFIQYLKSQPLMFEVFGHYQQHPLDKESKDASNVPSNSKDTPRMPPRRLMPKQLPISAPVKSQKYSMTQSASSAATSCATVHSRLDVLVWLEICELAPSGEYIPVLVDHEDETPCKGTFLMHQGIQRRIRLTILHDPDADVAWKEIRELVVGRVRTEAEISDDFEDDYDESILSLSLFPGEELASLDGRVVHRFEAAWDTSLHSSILLNRVTPSGERVFLTLSAYIDLEKCVTPAVITKDVCVIIYARDATIFPRSLKQLFSGHFRNQAYNHSSGMYELTLRRAVDTGSPGVARRQRKVLDTSTLYVRGEENLNGWTPRGDSLLFEHQWELEKMYRLEMTERIKHILAVNEKLKRPTEDELSKLSSSRINLAALTGSSFLTPSPSFSCLDSVATSIQTSTSTSNVGIEDPPTDRQRQICLKYLRLMQHQFASRAPTKVLATEDMVPVSTGSSPESVSPDSWPRKLSDNIHAGSTCGGNTIESLVGEGVSKKVIFTPDMEEIRLAPVSYRKGELLFYDGQNSKWIKRWLVVRRPYLFIFKDEKDPIERAVISLTRAQVIYTPDQPNRGNLFTLQCANREFTFKTTTSGTRREIHDWLYAINPLLAGEMLSKLSRDQKRRQ